MTRSIAVKLRAGYAEDVPLVATTTEGSPYPLSGYDIRAELRRSDNSLWLSRSSDNPDELVVTDGARGVFVVRFKSAETVDASGIYTLTVTAIDGFDAQVLVVPPSVLEVVKADAPPAGDSWPATTMLDHNFGMVDAYQCVTPGGSPIEGVTVTVYSAPAYDKGDYAHPVGRTLTEADGRWRAPVPVSPGAYVLHFHKASYYGPDVARVHVRPNA